MHACGMSGRGCYNLAGICTDCLSRQVRLNGFHTAANVAGFAALTGDYDLASPVFEF
jgi:hypothetical protein